MGSKIYTRGELAAMLPTPAIVQLVSAEFSDVDIGNACHELRLKEKRETKTKGRAHEAGERAERTARIAREAKEEADLQRRDVGSMLIVKRREWPNRGPRKGDPFGMTWGVYLQQFKLTVRRAHELMQKAGYKGEEPAEEEMTADTSSEDSSTLQSDHEVDIDLNVESEEDRSSGRGKPEWLMRLLVRHYSMDGDLVCDPFAGWGSTLRAALNEGRQAIGSEIDSGIASQAGKLPIIVGDWQSVLAGKSVDAIICDPPYSERTHAAATTRSDGSDAGGLTPTYSAWTPDHVHEFVKSWSPRCRGWMVALTDSELIPAYRDAYRNAGRYSFAPIPIVIKGMSVRISGDGPSSWCVYAMVARPSTEAFVDWGTLPGAYVGTQARDLFSQEVIDG